MSRGVCIIQHNLSYMHILEIAVEKYNVYDIA